MALFYVTVIGSLPGIPSIAPSPMVTFTPAGWVPDPAAGMLFPPSPQYARIFEGAFSAQLLATDTTDEDWTWQAAFSGIPGVQPYSFSFALPSDAEAFTATDASPCVVTAPGTAYADGQPLTLAPGPLPGGFAAGDVYYVTAVSGGAFSLAATPGGAAIASTSAGSGWAVPVVDISALAQVPSITPTNQYLPLTSGTPEDGQVPVFTGDGYATVPGSVGGSVQSFSASGSLTLAAAETTVEITGADVTVTLPAAASATAKTVTFKQMAPFTTGTVAAHGEELIDGFASYPMTVQYQWVTLQSDGSGWPVIGAKPGGLLTIPVTSLPDGTAEAAYSAQLTATGGWPGYTWSVKSGSLPDGVSLSASGLLSGTPSVATISSFTVQVTDSVGYFATASLSITVGGGLVNVQTGSLVNVSDGAPCSPVFATPTTEGNLLIAHIGCNGSGSVTTTAPGWVIDTGGGSGNYSVAYRLDCGAAETPPVFNRATVSDMWAYLEEWQGASTTAPPDQVTVSDDSAPSWTAVFPGLATTPGELLASSGYWNGSNTGGDVSLSSFLNSTGETITGTFLQGANAFGQYFAGVSGVSGPTGSDFEQVTMGLSVFAEGDGILVSFKPAASSPPGNPSVTTTSPLPAGSTQQPYSVTLAAQDGVPPYVWSLQSGSLPAGLALSSGGVIAGTPAAAGTASTLVRVTDTDSNSGTKSLSLPIAQTPAVTFTSSEAQGTSQPYTVAGIVGTTQGVTVNNNVWNPVTGWQSTVNVVDPTDWWVVGNFPAGNTAVSSYPSLDCVFSDLPLSGFSSITSSFSEQMNANPGTQSWAAYDIWCNDWANEIMIHHDLARFNPYDNTPVAVGIPFGGSGGIPELSWDLRLYGAAEYVWQPANNSFNIQSGSVDILAMLTWMVTNGFLPSVNTLTAIGYGWEICSTGGQDEFYKVSDFSLTATYAS